jgi:hypothetical protein
VVVSSVQFMKWHSEISGAGATRAGVASFAADVDAWSSALSHGDVSEFDETAALEAITSLERLKRAASGPEPADGCVRSPRLGRHDLPIR